MPKLLDIRIDGLNFPEVMAKIGQFLQSNGFHQIATVNPEFIVAAQKDKEFKDILNQTDINVPDGFGLQCAAWFKGQKIGERITGVDLTWEIAKLADEHGYSLYLLGGQPGIAEAAGQRLKIIYPNLKIAGIYAGSPQEEGIIEHITKNKADILLVAFGAPKQEKFIRQLKTANCPFKIAMGVGGTFDYIAGAIPRAPGWMRRLGLEWLYRLIRQPSRLKRIYNAVIVFPYLVLRHRKEI